MRLPSVVHILSSYLVLFAVSGCLGSERARAAVVAGKPFNPDTSVNFLGYVRRGNVNSGDFVGRASEVHNGFTFQEAEIQFFSDVDPYLKATALFSIAPEPGGGFGFEPEEVFFESTSLPMVSIRAGKFKAALGKHNILHTHAYPFVDAPLINQALFGGEGVNEVGVSASVLIPVSWFMELTAQALNNSNEAIYNSPDSGDMSAVAQLRNLWELSDDSTLEWAVYGTQGKNAASLTAQAGGTDLIYKWRPSEGGKYHAVIFANEFLYGDSPTTGFTVGPAAAPLNGEKLGGCASWLQYQFAERWWVQARAEYLGVGRSDALPAKRKQSALLGFFPSEFSGFRLQYDHVVPDEAPVEHAVTLQWNITIGAHPAHSY